MSTEEIKEIIIEFLKNNTGQNAGDILNQFDINIEANLVLDTIVKLIQDKKVAMIHKVGLDYEYRLICTECELRIAMEGSNVCQWCAMSEHLP